MSIRLGLIMFGFFCFINGELKADGTLMSWGMKDLVGMTEERFENSKTWNIDQILKKNKEVTDWTEVYLLLVAANEKKEEILPRLIQQLKDTSQTNLVNTSRLIIWERITNGDILFEGKGMQINDDLFTVAGRANWILRTLTEKDFGYVKFQTPIDKLKELSIKWENWIKGKEQEEYISPYGEVKNGLHEIKSKEALQAIICSLKMTEAKEKLTKHCLKKMYSLDELPKDPGSPANYCNPDTYSNLYLSKLTGIEEIKDYEWWMDWWMKNETNLKWNLKDEKFEIE